MTASVSYLTTGVPVPNLQKILVALLIFFCLTPWVSYGLNNLDSQPFPVIFAAIFLIVNLSKIRISAFSIVISLLTIFGLMLAFIFSLKSNFVILRGLYNGISFIVLYVTFENIFKRYKVIGLVKAINVLWILFCVFEFYFPEHVSALKQTRTTPDRGMTSLAAEPTFFAVYLILSSFLIFQMEGKQFLPSARLHIVNVLSILFLARSSMGVFLVAAGFAVWSLMTACFLTFQGKLLFRRLAHVSIIMVLFFPLVVFVSPYILADGRIAELLSIFNKVGVRELIMLDASINERVEHVILPWHGLIHRVGFPGGFGGLSVLRPELIAVYDGLFWYGEGGAINIMSYVGDWIFTLGLFGVAVIFLVFARAFDGTQDCFISLSVLLMVAMTCIPPSMPIMPMIFSYMAVRRRECNALGLTFYRSRK